jgi:ribosomal protein S27AE
MTTDVLTCPRCGSTRFREVDCGPDTYEDDIFYISQVCTNCGLWLSGWTDRWLVDVESWRDEEDAKEYQP